MEERPSPENARYKKQALSIIIPMIVGMVWLVIYLDAYQGWLFITHVSLGLPIGLAFVVFGLHFLVKQFDPTLRQNRIVLFVALSTYFLVSVCWPFFYYDSRYQRTEQFFHTQLLSIPFLIVSYFGCKFGFWAFRK